MPERRSMCVDWTFSLSFFFLFCLFHMVMCPRHWHKSRFVLTAAIKRKRKKNRRINRIFRPNSDRVHIESNGKHNAEPNGQPDVQYIIYAVACMRAPRLNKNGIQFLLIFNFLGIRILRARARPMAYYFITHTFAIAHTHTPHTNRDIEWRSTSDSTGTRSFSRTPSGHD